MISSNKKMMVTFASKGKASSSFAIVFLLVLSGCATMDHGQCTTSDWYDVGYSDGQRGASQKRIGEYANDCSEYGVRVDTQAFRDGWQQGIKLYCTADNGYRVGINGNFYADSCPSDLKDQFYAAYLLGDAVYDAKSRVSRLQSKIEELGDKATREGISDERRKNIRRDRKKLKKDLRDAEFDLIGARIRASKNGF